MNQLRALIHRVMLVRQGSNMAQFQGQERSLGEWQRSLKVLRFLATKISNFYLRNADPCIPTHHYYFISYHSKKRFGCFRSTMPPPIHLLYSHQGTAPSSDN